MTEPMAKPIASRRPRGRPRTTGEHTCDRCRRSAGKLRTHWPDGRICGICFHEAVRTFGACDRCHADRMLPGRSGDQRLCRGCAAITTDLDCHRCGAEAEHYRRGICARCALRDDLTELLTPDGRSGSALPALIAVLCAAGRPESIHTWKRHPSVHQLLSGLGRGDLTLTHESFDHAPPGRAIEHLRELLVHHNLLPDRDPDLARFEAWLRARLNATEPLAVRQPLEQFATWHHLRKIRAKITQGQQVRGSVHYAKQEITETGRLLSWLHEQPTTLATCTQGQIDQWLSDGPSTRTAARTFINWARRNRHTINVSIPARTPRSAPLITHQTRLDWLDRCLREQPDTLTYRAAATLLLLYAQPLVRVAAMRCEQIISGPDGISILLGSEPAAVPSPFGELLIDIIGNRPNLQTGNTGTSPWLFPSTRAGQHLHPNTIMTRLRDLGIDLRGARNAALRELVQQVPPPIVASQLGYSPQIALRHAELAAQPNGRYAALTSARLNTARPPQT